MSRAAITLLIAGGLLQLGGIFAVAWQDVAPSLVRAFSRGSDVYRRCVNLLLRAFGRAPRKRVIETSGTASIGITGTGSGVTSLAEGATLEEKVAFLLRRDREAQEAHNILAGRLTDFERDTVKRLDEARDELRRHHEEKLTEALNRHRAHRILGAILLAAGLLCLVAASFV